MVRLVGSAALWILVAVARLVGLFMPRTSVGYDGYVSGRIDEQRIQRNLDEARQRSAHDKAP